MHILRYYASVLSKLLLKIQLQIYQYIMRVDLSRDPLFQNNQSPSKDFKQKQRDRHKQMKSLRNTVFNEKVQLNIEIVDPLPEQLQKYKHEIQYKKMFESSKASQKLKKYIIEQERNLKCIRLEKITNDEEIHSSRLRKSAIKINMKSGSRDKQEKANKQINIPKIEEMFKNQQKQYVLYESRMMRNQLGKAINLIDNSLTKLKSYSSVSATTSLMDTKKTTATDKFPNNTSNHQNHHSHQNSTTNVVLNEEDCEIDKIIEKKMMMSKKLRDKLYREKKEMMTHQAKQSSESKNLGFFINIPKKPKKKVILEGVKSITFYQGDRKLQITPASSLLFSMNKMSNGRDKKQIQLQGLIQNSYQNREAILSQKSTFYDKQTPFNDLSPSNQFKLRQLMDKKLMHRLQLSKEQVNKFTSYLSEIKEYHVILNQTILEILKEVREILMTGKVMKTSDLTTILQSKQKNQLVGHPNELILQKLFDMMV